MNNRKLGKKQLLELHYEKGKNLYEIDEFRLALMEFTTVEDFDPFYKQTRDYVTNCLVNLNYHAESIKYLLWKLENDQAEPRLYINLSIAYAEIKQFSDAERMAIEGINAYPDEADLYCCLGDALRKQGYFSIALKCYQDALDIDPENISALSNVALFYRDRSKALRVYEQALKRLPDNLQLLENAQRACKAIGREFRRQQILNRMRRVPLPLPESPAYYQ